MSTPRMNTLPRLTPLLLKHAALQHDEFFLVDVGCSGGVEEHWKAFGPKLRAVGFDPLVTEVERLNSLRPSDKIRYEAAFVVCHEKQMMGALLDPAESIAHKDNQPFPRSSAKLFNDRRQMDYVKTVFNSGQQVVLADRRVQLDDYFPLEQHAALDFIKVDTDGYDFGVLLGARKILEHGQVLGLSVEAQFHGAVSENVNLFCNVDRYLRSLGFTLFDLEPYRYSRGALPAPFEHKIPAQTRNGQVAWAEAIYMRDLGDPAYAQKWGYQPTEAKVLKLACLFEVFGLADCAAELLVNAAGRFPALEDPRPFLDALTPRFHDQQVTYAEYMQAFLERPELFFPDGSLGFLSAEAKQKLDPEKFHPSGRVRRQPSSIKKLKNKIKLLINNSKSR